MSAICTCGDEMSLYWQPSLNEDGWRCACEPAAEPGFRPDLDRAETWAKARAILSALHDAGLVYVSNGTMGDVIAENVAGRCAEADAYDQYSILTFILADPNLADHAEFWRDEAAGVVESGGELSAGRS